MPIDNYKMSIQAKPLFGSIAKTDSEGGALVEIVRPLGRVRKPKSNSFSLPKQSTSLPRARKLLDDHHLLHPDKSEPTVLTDDDYLSKRATSSVSRTESFLDNISLPPMSSRSRSKVFENRYKIASRKSSDDVKPAKLYSKKVIYLPMFRVNVETYVGSSEDSKAVETTRQSLKRIIDQGKQLRARSASRMAPASIKSFNFVAPGREGVVNSLEPAVPRKLIHTDKSFLSTTRAMTNRPDIGEYEESQYFTKNVQGSVSDDTDRMDVQFETLELNSIDDGMSGVHDNISTVSPGGKINHENPMTEFGGSVRKDRMITVQSLSDPYRNSRGEILNRQQKIGWPSFDDIKKMKQKIRWQKNAQRQTEKEQVQNGVKPKSDVQRWVNIHYTKPKPVLQYTAQPTITRLDPIIVPSHTCVDCPMCRKELEQTGTSAPPNSPDNHERSSATKDNWRSPRQSDFKSPSDQSMGKDSSLTSRSNQSSRSEVFMIPKVTVKVLDSKAKLEEAKMSYTKASS